MGVPTTVPYAIGDLATLGGVSRRTVRYYVQEGLIPPPIGLGRGNHYTPAHLEQLLRVKEMQEAGRTLAEVRRALGQNGDARGKVGRTRAEELLPRSLWRHIPLAPGVELHVSSTVRLPPGGRLRELADWCRLHFVESAQLVDEKRDRHG